MLRKIMVAVLSFILLMPLAAADRQPAVQTATRPDTAPQPQAPQPLSEAEQNQLARRQEQPSQEVAGGALSNEHLTYVVIALAAAVLVLILK